MLFTHYILRISNGSQCTGICVPQRQLMQVIVTDLEYMVSYDQYVTRTKSATLNVSKTIFSLIVFYCMNFCVQSIMSYFNQKM